MLAVVGGQVLAGNDTSALTGAPLVLVVVPVLAVVLAGLRLREQPAGPNIHDRQLDLIIVVGAIVGAVTLIVAQLTGAGGELGRLAPPFVAVAVLAAIVGTRRLWQVRAVPMLMLLAWPAPWTAAAAVIPAGAVVNGVLPGLAVGVTVAVAVRAGAVRRAGVLAGCGAGGAGAAFVFYALGGEPGLLMTLVVAGVAVLLTPVVGLRMHHIVVCRERRGGAHRVERVLRLSDDAADEVVLRNAA